MTKVILQKPALVCYDWDNTLVDTNVLCIHCFNAVFLKRGMPLIDQSQMDVINGYIFDDYLKERFGDEYETIKAEYSKLYVDNVKEMLKPLPNAIETVKHFHNLNIRQIVISNKSSDMIREEAARMGFNPYIEHFFGLNDFGVAKPDPKFFDAVVEAIAVDRSVFHPENLFFFGDSSVDINFAKNINAKLIFVGPEYILKNSDYNNSVFIGKHKNLLNAIDFSF